MLIHRMKLWDEKKLANQEEILIFENNREQLQSYY